MKQEYSISIYLDRRRLLKSKKYPVRLRVFTASPRKQKFYPTIFEYTEKEFNSIWGTVKTRDENKIQKRDIQAVLNKAEDTAKKLDPFTFEEFEKILYQKTGDAENVFIKYDKAIQAYKENGQLGTASNYELSLKSVKSFLVNWKGREPSILLFREITVDWLNRYENYMILAGKSQTTVGIYLRPLRALFRSTLAEGVLKHELYPFGRNKYEIPQSKTVRKALSKEQLRILLDAKPENKYQEKAKDFWFFLFNTAGINIKDLARLKYINLQNDKLIYIREKTKRTTKAKLKPVVVYLNDYSRNFIEKYGNPDKQPQNLIFDIFQPGMTESDKFKKAGLYTRALNQHLKKLATANGLPGDISTYWSRHSFATNAIRGGASLEQIQQALNHQNLTTTQNYFAGFEDDSMQQLTNKLMDF